MKGVITSILFGAIILTGFVAVYIAIMIGKERKR